MPVDLAGVAAFRDNALQAIKTKQYSKILAHEQAHQSAAGPYGGGIVIQYDSNGVAIGGHVPVHFPGMDVHHPEKSLQAYQMIRNAALAPGADASAQDFAVANLAQAQIGKAQLLLNQKLQHNKSK
jgi:hypothetical protein